MLLKLRILPVLVFVLSGCSILRADDSHPIPMVGDQAGDFELPKLASDGKLSLAAVRKSQPVVLVVLRGYPGYQCPICSRQVGGLIQQSKKIAATRAKVILVYPGLAEDLENHAKEFFSNHPLPANFVVVTDPDYSFTNQYGLRWDAPRETAYPSTFVINQQGKVVFAKVSKTHGDRSRPEDVIAALDSLN